MWVVIVTACLYTAAIKIYFIVLLASYNKLLKMYMKCMWGAPVP